MARAITEQDVIERLREAAFDGEQWIPALDAFARATGARSGNLVGVRPNFMNFNLASNVDPQLWEDLDATMRGNPALNPRVLNGVRARPMSLIGGIDFASDEWTRRFPEYGEACRRYDVGGGTQSVLLRTDSSFIGIATLRSAREGLATAEQNEIFARLAPHVLDAVRVQSMMEDRMASQTISTLEAIAAAAFLCDETGRVTAMTGGAEHLALQQDILTVRQGRLTGWSDAVGDQLSSAIWSSGHKPDQGMQTLIIRQRDGYPVRIEISALPRKTWSMGVQARVIVTVQPAPKGPTLEQICTVFGLTQAEGEVTLLVARGMSRSHIAVSRGVSAGTVKSQLKAIFGKLDVARESEIPALLRGL